MLLVFQVISQDHVIKGLFGWLFGWELSVISHQPGKFGCHWHCDSENINIPANTVILLQIRNMRDSIHHKNNKINNGNEKHPKKKKIKVII